MKTPLFFTIVFLSALCLRAQDTLYTSGGKAIGARIMEINPNEVKYKKATNPDGPVYVMDRDDVAMIIYQNGTKDVFSKETGEIADNSSAQETVILERPAVNVVINALPTLAWGALSYAWGAGWGWGWGGWCRPVRVHSHHNHYNHHHGHYGRRGGR